MHVLRGVFGKLKIAPGGAVPFRDCQIVLIDRVQQSASGLQKGVLSSAVFERRRQTAGQILLHHLRAFLRGPGGRGERFFANLGCLKIVCDMRDVAGDIRFQLMAGQLVYLLRRTRS